MKYNLKWTNIHSYESGYVAKVSNVNKCFINTYEKDKQVQASIASSGVRKTEQKQTSVNKLSSEVF